MSLTIFYSTKKDSEEYSDYIESKLELDDTEIYQFTNKGTNSLANAYNIGLQECDTRYILFIHDDLMLPKGFDSHLMEYFKKDEFGILGIAGTPYMSEKGVWWDKRHFMCGQVGHMDKKKKKKWLNRYSCSYESPMPVVCVDGLYIAVDTEKIKHGFDESFEGFHFYDLPFCIDNHLAGVNIGVMSDMKIVHKSIGQVNDEYHINRLHFIEKYKDKLPIKINPSIKIEKELKPVPTDDKVAIIIPTKDNNEILFKCVNSIIEHTDTDYTIYIADTGSSDENKIELKGYCEDKPISLIEYDYYNFAKINNDVITNHVQEEIILFCNDDIELENNAIDLLKETLLSDEKNGTIGARLHYPDNRVQHGGILVYGRKKDKTVNVTHKGIGTYFGANPKREKVVGNTGAFMMVRKKDFENGGMFNEDTIECFEDLILNINLLALGKNNIFDGRAVAVHHESVTRKKNIKKTENESRDYKEILLPHMIMNLKSIKKYIKWL